MDESQKFRVKIEMVTTLEDVIWVLEKMDLHYTAKGAEDIEEAQHNLLLEEV